MLRKFAVALLAASVLTAPVLAQGMQPANPPAKTGTVAPAATPAAPKVVTAKPTLRVAKVKHGKRFSARHVAQVKHVKHVRAAQALHGAKTFGAKTFGVKHARHVVRSKPTTDARGGAMTSAKSRSITN
jgi:hypothetical protein